MQARHATQSTAPDLVRLSASEHLARQDKISRGQVDNLRFRRNGSENWICGECEKAEAQNIYGTKEGGEKYDDANEDHDNQETSNCSEINKKAKTNGPSQSSEVNTFLEQLISDRLKDLVTVQPNGEIMLNMSEQLSATL